MTVKKGELVALYGRVGSGKTSILSAIIGEMNKVEGTVQVHGRVAYAAQNPWIMSSSVRENITFFRKFDQTYYDLVLDGEHLPRLTCSMNADRALFGSLRSSTRYCVIA